MFFMFWKNLYEIATLVSLARNDNLGKTAEIRAVQGGAKARAKTHVTEHQR